jgi:diguanylate cyclase (GGDEF)-like protein
MKQVQRVKELEALFLILPLLPYAFFTIGFIMGWRFNNAGMVLTTFILGLSYFALFNLDPVGKTRSLIAPSIPEALSFLLPLNLAFFATLARRRILTPMGLYCAVLILFQVFGIVLLCSASNSPFYPLAVKIKSLHPFIYRALSGFSIKLLPILQGESFLGFKNVSTFSMLSFLAALFFLSMRFKRDRDALSAGSLATLIAVFLGTAYHPGPSAMLYFSAAGLILIITSIETSFSMAYMDELTGLPGRRSLNEALLNLGRNYAIAMIDIDRFKKFNDTYGHKTGDQVLKMVALKLKELTGGAKVFRYGGEEFTAIFPGKTAKEVVPHLDAYRKIVESTPFVVRGKGRRKRSAEDRGKIGRAGRKGTNITVSIGVASPNRRLTSPEKVLKSADNVLYRAKKEGRNRVKK